MLRKPNNSTWKARGRLLKRSQMRVPVHLTQTLIDAVHNLPNGLAEDHLKTQFLQKFVSSETDPPDLRRSRAIEKWLAVETKNSETNDRLFGESGDNFPSFADRSLFEERLRSVVLTIVGELPPEDALIGSFSGGASTSRNRLHSHPTLKYSGKADATSACLDLFVSSALDLCPGMDVSRLTFNEVNHNILFTVPKKTDIDRCACKEPDVNMWLQKGVGNHIRKCLLKKGINLNDQSINRGLAREGSITGSLATLDLSSASDSVTTGLCFIALPIHWYSLLMTLRAESTLVDGTLHRNEMLSSMGNGFTFELESLLFYSLARTTAWLTGTRGVISVYGDDLIVPTALVAPLVEVLSYYGFSVNTDKSFSDGPFRESCGGHYHNGYDVTPFFLRRPLDTYVDLIHICNQIRIWSARSQYGILSPTLGDLWSVLKSHVPVQFWGGHNLESNDQLVSWDEPNCRLLEVSPVSPYNETVSFGSYMLWLNNTWNRRADPSGDTVEVVNHTGLYRSRRAPRGRWTFGRPIPWDTEV